MLRQFREVSEDKVKKIINGMATKSCKSDPIPTSLLKQILSAVISAITKIMNVSLRDGIFASNWKTAIVRPLLKKKLGLQLVLSNFRPVSNLPFLAKALEKCALAQLHEHCKANAPILDYQSAYREHYSHETALAKLVIDLLWSMEEGCVTSFIAIDLAATFVMVSHDILLDLVEVWYGVTGKALAWFNSYLCPSNFKVNVNSAYSKPKNLEYSMPQGSCLGPVAYLLYASSLEEVIAPPEPPDDPEEKSPTAEKINLHGHADDHGIKNVFKPVHDNETATTKLLSDCLTRIKSWMGLNRLQMNDAKMEYIQFRVQAARAKCMCDHIDVNGTIVSRSNFIKYQGAILDMSCP